MHNPHIRPVHLSPTRASFGISPAQDVPEPARIIVIITSLSDGLPNPKPKAPAHCDWHPRPVRLRPDCRCRRPLLSPPTRIRKPRALRHRSNSCVHPGCISPDGTDGRARGSTTNRARHPGRNPSEGRSGTQRRAAGLRHGSGEHGRLQGHRAGCGICQGQPGSRGDWIQRVGARNID